MRRNGVAVAISLVAVAIVLCLFWPREPRIQGHPLSAWLTALDDGNGEKGITWSPNEPVRPTPLQIEAAAAIRSMGSSARPYLLDLLQAKEPLYRSLKAALRQWSSRLRLANVPRQIQYERQTPASILHHRAALGLIALEPTDRPAVSELGPLLIKDGCTKETALVLASLGAPGLGPLMPFVRTNQSSWQAICAVWALAQFPTNAGPIVPELLTGLTNNAVAFKNASVWALSRVRVDPEVAVQALTNAAGDPAIRYMALKAIESYGNQATSAVPFLRELVRSQPRPDTHDARELLKKIDPEAAAREGVK